MSVRVVWDEAKRISNLAKHRLDFAAVADVFDGRFVLVAPDERYDYGEQRFNLLSEFHGMVVHVMFTRREDAYRLISARRANQTERVIYDKANRQNRN